MFNTKTSLALASATKEQEKAEEDALLSEPHPTTLWKPLGDRNYRYPLLQATFTTTSIEIAAPMTPSMIFSIYYSFLCQKVIFLIIIN